MIKDESMNIEYNLDYTTNEKSSWVNKCTHIMLHHTWGWSFSWNMSYLSRIKYNNGSRVYASSQYVIWDKWEIWRMWLDTFILWHAWSWRFPWIPDNLWNSYSIWIEIVSAWKVFTVAQIEATAKLVRELKKKHNIDNSRVIRHKDYAWYRWKWDPGDNFYKTVWCDSYKQWLEEKVDLQFVKAPIKTTKKVSNVWDYRKLAWKSPFRDTETAWKTLQAGTPDEALAVVETMINVKMK